MINWDKIKHFSSGEFSEDPNKYAAPGLILSLDDYRHRLGAAVFPSPVSGALARFTGSARSRHYAVDRLSDGIDVFCNCGIFRAWSAALHSGLWGGIGVYFDTKYRGSEWPMLHLDKRQDRLVWYRNEHRYYYPDNDGSWAVLGRLLSRKVSKFS